MAGLWGQSRADRWSGVGAEHPPDDDGLRPVGGQVRRLAEIVEAVVRKARAHALTHFETAARPWTVPIAGSVNSTSSVHSAATALPVCKWVLGFTLLSIAVNIAGS